MPQQCNQKTEVYSRVCGYHRPVRNWNKGKQSEFDERTEYDPKKITQKKEKA